MIKKKKTTQHYNNKTTKKLDKQQQRRKTSACGIGLITSTFKAQAGILFASNLLEQ